MLDKLTQFLYRKKTPENQYGMIPSKIHRSNFRHWANTENNLEDKQLDSPSKHLVIQTDF